MMTDDYRPARIEFKVLPDGTNVPESLGEFATAEEAAKFIGSNLASLNRGVTVSRLMDAYEKSKCREDYQDVMENLVPIYEKELSAANIALSNAKAILKHAEEAYDFTITRAKNLAAEAKRGLKDIVLDEKYTSRIAYQGRYYFFTYIDGALRLCLIREIPESEKSEIWNQMAGNEEFIDREYDKHEKVAAQIKETVKKIRGEK
jgi:hypothetical protein